MSKLSFENGFLVSKEDGKEVCIIADAVVLRDAFMRASWFCEDAGLPKTAKRYMEKATCIAATQDFRG